ncbi:MAG: type II toxin-antitoxin system ParD family antitoxin [Chloroflexia bacterium]|nr:type II toxin-antitoxin system ParD family antitoxin [Chloroflexia bacterium]
MTIQLHRDTEAAIRGRVESGQYKDVEEVIRAALDVLEIQEIRASIAEGRAAIKRGEGIVLTPDVWDQIEREADELAQSDKPLRPHVLP